MDANVLLVDMQESVDVTGAVCPKPALIVRRCLTELEPGDELLVTGDYPPAERNLRRTCYKHGFEVSDERRESDGSSDRKSNGVSDGPDHNTRNDGTFQLTIHVTEESSIGA